MFDAIIHNMIQIGLAKLARSVAEVTLENRDSDFSTTLAFLDSISAAELLIKARILEIEVQQKEKVSELRVNELVYGSTRLPYNRLPQELEKVSGYSLKKPQQYLEMTYLRDLVIKEWLSPEKLVKPTLCFAFEVIEPMLIECWKEIILAHVPEYDFEIDLHINKCLIKYGIESHGLDNNE